MAFHAHTDKLRDPIIKVWVRLITSIHFVRPGDRSGGDGTVRVRACRHRKQRPAPPDDPGADVSCRYKVVNEPIDPFDANERTRIPCFPPLLTAEVPGESG